MTFDQAMMVARRDGKAVRHDELNSRWSVVWDETNGYMMQSTLGGSYTYTSTERDTRQSWRCVDGSSDKGAKAKSGVWEGHRQQRRVK